MQTESVSMTIKPIPGAFGGNPPCIINTPLGRRISDSLESAIQLAEIIGAGICRSRFVGIDDKDISFDYEIVNNSQDPNGFGSRSTEIVVITSAKADVTPKQNNSTEPATS